MGESATETRPYRAHSLQTLALADENEGLGRLSAHDPRVVPNLLTPAQMFPNKTKRHDEKTESRTSVGIL